MTDPTTPPRLSAASEALLLRVCPESDPMRCPLSGGEHDTYGGICHCGWSRNNPDHAGRARPVTADSARYRLGLIEAAVRAATLTAAEADAAALRESDTRLIESFCRALVAVVDHSHGTRCEECNAARRLHRQAIVNARCLLFGTTPAALATPGVATEGRCIATGYDDHDICDRAVNDPVHGGVTGYPGPTHLFTPPPAAEPRGER